MEIDAAAQQTVLQHRPAAAARRITVIASLPGELHARAPIPGRLAAIHPPLHRDETEAARPVLAELDERGPHQVQGLPVPQLRLYDPPPARDAHRPSLPVTRRR